MLLSYFSLDFLRLGGWYYPQMHQQLNLANCKIDCIKLLVDLWCTPPFTCKQLISEIVNRLKRMVFGMPIRDIFSN